MQQGSYNRDIFHGGDLTAAKIQFGGDAPTWLDLSTGINPHPYPLPDISNDGWNRLPSAELENALLAAARRYYGVASDTPQLAAPGTQSLIQLLPLITPKTTVAILCPTYGEHAKCWSQAGHQVIEVTALGDIPTDCTICVVVAPNNPTGKDYPPKILGPLAEELKARGGFLVIDEAFRDVMPENSLEQGMPTDGVIIFKSFGKFFGLAGVRLGFAMGDRQLIASLNAALGPWAVSGIAMEVATAAFADTNWIADTRARLARDHTRLNAALVDAGFDLVGGTDLFSYVHKAKAAALYTHFCEAHILLRPFEHDPAKLRFGHPKNEDDWQRLFKILKALA